MKVNTSALDAIWQASFLVQLTLIILVGLSVFCWAIAISKYKQFKAISETNRKFLNSFWNAKSLEAIYEDFASYAASPLARVFKAGYVELQKLADQAKPVGNNENEESISFQRISGSDNLERELSKAIDLEVALMESRLTMLATTGSTGPFIGLFGTVWGIMTSFHKIGQMGSASLAVVAPGISEALISTAIGLAAAIPAVVLYNHFIAKIRREEMALGNFRTDFLNITKRNFFKA